MFIPERGWSVGVAGDSFSPQRTSYRSALCDSNWDLPGTEGLVE